MIDNQTTSGRNRDIERRNARRARVNERMQHVMRAYGGRRIDDPHARDAGDDGDACVPLANANDARASFIEQTGGGRQTMSWEYVDTSHDMM